MKILMVNCVYNTGSTGKIVYDTHTYLLKQGIKSVVYYGRGARVSQNCVHKLCPELYAKANNLLSRFTGLMYGGCLISTHRLIKKIQKEAPDVVHLHCINGYFVNIYRLISWLKKHSVKTVLTLHAEFMYTANCGHAFDCTRWLVGCGNCPRLKQETKSWFFDRTALSYKKMKEAFEGFEKDLLVVSVSPWLMARAKQSPILGSMTHTCVYNGVDTDVFRVYPQTMLKERYCPHGEKLIFHATAEFSDAQEHPKGGYWLFRLAEQMKELPVRFVVAGTAHISGNIPENVVMLGKVTDQKLLAELYAAADLTLLVSRKETFSMIVAESLCCGTPVVGFKAGAPEIIALKEYSQFVEYGHLDELSAGVSAWLSKIINYDDISRKAFVVYSKERMITDYVNIYERFFRGHPKIFSSSSSADK